MTADKQSEIDFTPPNSKESAAKYTPLWMEARTRTANGDGLLQIGLNSDAGQSATTILMTEQNTTGNDQYVNFFEITQVPGRKPLIKVYQHIKPEDRARLTKSDSGPISDKPTAIINLNDQSKLGGMSPESAWLRVVNRNLAKFVGGREPADQAAYKAIYADPSSQVDMPKNIDFSPFYDKIMRFVTEKLA